MFKSIVLSGLLLPNLAPALVKPADVIAIQAPRGVRVVTVPEREHALTPEELVARYTQQVPAFDFRVAFHQLSEPITESNLYSRYRTEMGLVLSKFVRLAVELMRAKGVTLNVARGTPVRFDFEAIHRAGRTTMGMVDACWECYDGAGNREYVANALGLNSGSLENKVSNNPRFAPRQLFRGSASQINFTFDTNERGPVQVPLLIQMDESYQMFVADLPPVGKRLFGDRVYGSSQRVRFIASAPLDPTVFGVKDVEFTELDLFSVSTAPAPSEMPLSLLEVRDYAVPEGVRRKFVRQAISDLNSYQGRYYPLTSDRLILPGKLQMLETPEF